MNLKTKNVLLTMSVLSVLLLTVVGATYQSTTVVIEKTIADHQLALAADRVKATEIWLDQQMRILKATARAVPFGALGNNQGTMAPLKMAMNAGHFSDVYIGLSNGILIDGADWEPSEDYDPRIRPWYRRAESTGATSFTTPYLDLVTMKLVIALATPLRYQGQFYGVMGADTVLDSLVKTLLSTKVGETGYIFVVNSNGTILIHPQRPNCRRSSRRCGISPSSSKLPPPAPSITSTRGKGTCWPTSGSAIPTGFSAPPSR